MADAGIAAPVSIIVAEREHPDQIMGIPVLSGDDRMGELDVEAFVIGVGSTSTSPARQILYLRGLGHGFRPLTLIHPSAQISGSARIGPGCQVLTSAVVGTGSSLGENVLVNTSAVIEHDSVIGSHVHIATGARLAGGVHVGEGSHIGIGAVVREGVRIGSGVLVAAGAVVVSDVPDDARVAGVPAKSLDDDG
jgi:UDP-perosamine 4-acetyltransferase